MMVLLLFHGIQGMSSSAAGSLSLEPWQSLVVRQDGWSSHSGGMS